MLQQKIKNFKSSVAVLLAAVMFLAVLPWKMAYAETDWLGDGTEQSPYIITTADQLVFLAERVNDGDTNFNDKYYKLRNNIDLLEYNADNLKFNNGKGWVPIGRIDNAFKGHFDGDGKEILGMYINDDDLDYAGLFGVINDGCVKNLNIVDVNITAGVDVGGVVGMIYTGTLYLDSILTVISEETFTLPTTVPVSVPTGLPTICSQDITNCYVTGIIKGDSCIGGIAGSVEFSSNNTCYTTASIYGINYVGGIAGYIGEDSNLSNCYSTGNVYGQGSDTGGIVGIVRNNVATVSNCYATGTVSGGSNVGGVAGSIAGDTLCGQFKANIALNKSVSGASSVGRVIGKETTNLSRNYAYNHMDVKINGADKTLEQGADKADGLDITAEDFLTATFWRNTEIWDDYSWKPDIWKFEDGKLPVLTNVGGIQNGSFTGYWLGDGTEQSPYIITTAHQLAFLAKRINNADTNFNNKYYKLGNNIDLSEYNADNLEFNDGKGWVPIGRDYVFKGYFDGDGKEISGLYINDDLDYMGLFGIVDGGSVKNLGIVDANITGRDNVGGVAGNAYVKTFLNSSLVVTEEEVLTPPTVSPTPMPNPYARNITGCYVTGIIKGNDSVGGIVGMQEYGIIDTCYSTANISGMNYIGGIVGRMEPHSGVANSYSNGNIYGGGSNIGGVVGFVINSASFVSHCYATGAVKGTDNVGGVIGNISGNIWWGPIEANAALNKSVSGASSVGRVMGAENTNLSLNYAYNRMKVKIDGADKTLEQGEDKADGLDITTEGFLTATFWRNTEIWDDYSWKPDIWKFEDGKLPVLTNVGGIQNGDFTEYNRAKILNVLPNQENNTVTVELTVEEEENVVLIVASYVEERLLNAQLKPIEKKGDSVLTLNIPENADTVKAMIWRDVYKSEPLCVSKKVERSNG